MSTDPERYADYSEKLTSALGPMGGEHEVYLRIKASHLRGMTRRALGALHLLDAVEFGSGAGLMAEHLAPGFASYTGIDIDPTVQDEAERRVPGATFLTYDGTSLPLQSESCDVVFAVNVFHHIPPDQRVGAVRRLRTLLRPGGLLAIAEHNPANPLTRWVVSRCVFDFDAVLLSAGEAEALLEDANLRDRERRFVVFLPSAAGWALRLESVFRRLPLGAQYVVSGRRD